jgi:hypothetical protein
MTLRLSTKSPERLLLPSRLEHQPSSADSGNDSDRNMAEVYARARPREFMASVA